MLWNRNDLLRLRLLFRFLLWKSLVPVPVPAPIPVPVPDPDLFSIVKTTKFVPNLAFSMLEAALFPRKLACNVLFLTFVLHFLLNPGPNPVSRRHKVAVSAVPVPAPIPQNCR